MKGEMMSPTIEDIARLVGVAKSTVHSVLHTSNHRKATDVMKAMDRLQDKKMNEKGHRQVAEVA